MNFLYKCIFLFFILFHFNNEVSAKQKSKKSAQSTQQIKKNGSNNENITAFLQNCIDLSYTNINQYDNNK